MNCTACSTALAPRATFCGECGRAVEDPFRGKILDGRYRIETRIAIGGFGAVYRAARLDGEPDLAIKVMHPDLAADANLVARFRREGTVLLELRDPHSVATYQLGDTPEGQPFIAMELLEGRTLVDLFHASGPLPWQRVLPILRAICSALAEAHALGVVHRDLKPANIFLLRDDFVKVLDFGIAKIIEGSRIQDGSELTQLGHAVGTLEYMAPEQLMGGKCDGRTDLYTLGVVGFELLTGRRPFPAAGLDLLTLQLSAAAPPVSSVTPVPASVDRVIALCLAQDQADRFADAAELARAIDAALAERSAPAAPPPAPLVSPAPLEPHVYRPAASTPVPLPPAMTRPPPAPQRVAARAPAWPRTVLLAVAIALAALGLGAALAFLI